jgi:hypothetical protein
MFRGALALPGDRKDAILNQLVNPIQKQPTRLMPGFRCRKLSFNQSERLSPFQKGDQHLRTAARQEIH